MHCQKLLLTYWVKLSAIGGFFNSLEPIPYYGVAMGVVFFLIHHFLFEFVTTSFEYGGELSSSKFTFSK
jgi:hypothetical protein